MADKAHAEVRSLALIFPERPVPRGVAGPIAGKARLRTGRDKETGRKPNIYSL